MIDYLKKSNVSRILTIGDSQGARYNQAVITLLTAANFTCSQIKKESDSFKPGKGYFTQGTNIKTNAIITSARTCHTCMSVLHECTSSQLIGRKVEVEYVSMMMVANSSIVPNKKYCKEHASESVCQVTTQQEFLFKIYLKDRGYPDLVFIYGTFEHDTWKTFQFVDRAVHHVIDLIQECLPPSSKTVWFTSSSLNMKKMAARLVNTRHENGLTMQEKVQALNWLLFHALKPKLALPGQYNMYVFFYLHSMSAPIQMFWSQDMVHYTRHWYKYVIDYLFAMLDAEMFEV